MGATSRTERWEKRSSNDRPPTAVYLSARQQTRDSEAPRPRPCTPEGPLGHASICLDTTNRRGVSLRDDSPRVSESGRIVRRDRFDVGLFGAYSDAGREMVG